MLPADLLAPSSFSQGHHVWSPAVEFGKHATQFCVGAFDFQVFDLQCPFRGFHRYLKMAEMINLSVSQNETKPHRALAKFAVFRDWLVSTPRIAELVSRMILV